MKMSFRQGIARYQTDLDNNQLFLKLSGGQVTLYVSPDPTIISISHGTSEYLYTESVTIPNAWGGIFNTFTDYWLYWDINLTTGVRTFGHTVIEPITQALAPPTTPVLDQHWFDTTTNTMKVWVGARWVEKVRVFAAKLAQGTTFLSMSAKTPIFSGTQSGYTNNFNSGAITFDLAGKPIKNSLGKFFTTEDLFTAGVPSGSSLKINTIIVDAQVQAPIAAFTVVQFIDFNKVTHADPHQQNTVVYGIVEEDAFTADNVRVVTEGRLTYDQWDWPADGAEVNDYLYISLTGELQLTQSIANQTPVGQVIDKQTIIFRPSVLKAILEGGVDDHTELTSLDSDDHTQYYNEVRGDIQYYPRTELEPILTAKSDVGHTHPQSEVTGLVTDLSGKVSKSGDVMVSTANLTFSGGGEVLGLPAVPSSDPAAASKLYVDNQVSPKSDLSYVNDQLALKSDVGHTHPSSGSTRIEDADGDTYVDTELDANDNDIIVMALGTEPAGVADGFNAGTVVTLGRASLDFTALGSSAYDQSGADINITAGGGSAKYGHGGDVNITAGTATHSDYFTRGGSVNITGGVTTASGASPGHVDLTGGISADGKITGNIDIRNQPCTSVGAGTQAGGDVLLSGSQADEGTGGSVDVSGGDGINGGRIDIFGGTSTQFDGSAATPANHPSSIQIIAGDNTGGTGPGGGLLLESGDSDNGRGGDTEIRVGAGRNGNRGGVFKIRGGSSDNANTYDCLITACGSNDYNGGDVRLQGGSAGTVTLVSGKSGDAIIEGGDSDNSKAPGGNAIVVGGRGASSTVASGANIPGDVHLTVRHHEFVTANKGVIKVISDEETGFSAFLPEMQIFSDDYVNHVKFQAPAGLAAPTQFTLPPTNGTVDHVLRTDGSGNTSWVAAAGGGSSPLTTKGDLYTYDTGDQRLAIGDDDFVLTADAAQPTGMKWAAAAGGGGGGSKIEDANGDTWVDTEVGADDDEIVLHLGVEGNWAAANVAEFERTRTNITALVSTANARGGSTNIYSGGATFDGTSADSGHIRIISGQSQYASGGNVQITAGGSNGGYPSSGTFGGSNEKGGDILIDAGAGGPGSNYSNDGGHVTIASGYSYGASSGNISISTPNENWNGGYNDAATGSITIETGSNYSDQVTDHAGDINITGGYSSYGDPGSVIITAGAANTNAAGRIQLIAGHSPIGPGSVDIKNASSIQAGSATFYDFNDSNYVMLKAPATVTTNRDITLPQDAPAVGEVLQTDASGITSWEGLQYIYTATPAATATFVINHGLGQQFVMVQAYENGGASPALAPISNIVLTDANNCTVTLTSTSANIKIVVIGVPNVT